MTTPTRVLSTQERTVLAAYAVGAEIPAIAAKFDIGHGRVSQIVVDLAGISRNVARILVENHDGKTLAPGRTATARTPARVAHATPPAPAKPKRAPKAKPEPAEPSAPGELTADDRAILASYVDGKDLAVMADEFGLTQSKLRLAILSLCGFDMDTARRLLHPAVDLTAAAFAEPADVAPSSAAEVTVDVDEPPAFDIEPAGDEPDTTVDEAPPAEPDTVAPDDLTATGRVDVDEEPPAVEAENHAPVVNGALIAAYIAHRCDPCHYTGPADHEHPTRRVRVEILEIGGV